MAHDQHGHWCTSHTREEYTAPKKPRQSAQTRLSVQMPQSMLGGELLGTVTPVYMSQHPKHTTNKVTFPCTTPCPHLAAGIHVWMRYKPEGSGYTNMTGRYGLPKYPLSDVCSFAARVDEMGGGGIRLWRDWLSCLIGKLAISCILSSQATMTAQSCVRLRFLERLRVCGWWVEPGVVSADCSRASGRL